MRDQPRIQPKGVFTEQSYTQNCAQCLATLKIVNGKIVEGCRHRPAET